MKIHSGKSGAIQESNQGSGVVRRITHSTTCMYEKAPFCSQELALGKLAIQHLGSVKLESIILITPNLLSTE